MKKFILGFIFGFAFLSFIFDAFGETFSDAFTEFTYSNPMLDDELIEWFPLTIGGASNNQGVNGGILAFTGLSPMSSTPCNDPFSKATYGYGHFMNLLQNCPNSLGTSGFPTGAYITLPLFNSISNSFIYNSLNSSTGYTICANIYLPDYGAQKFTSSSDGIYSDSMTLWTMDLGGYDIYGRYYYNQARYGKKTWNYIGGFSQYPATDTELHAVDFSVPGRAPTELNDGIFHFVCYTYPRVNGFKSVISVDGLVSSGTSNSWNSMTPRTINFFYDVNGYRYFGHAISDILIFKRAFEANELAEMTRTFNKSFGYTLTKKINDDSEFRYMFPGQSYFDSGVVSRVSNSTLLSSDYARYIIRSSNSTNYTLSVDPFSDQFIKIDGKNDEWAWDMYKYSSFTGRLIHNDPTISENTYATGLYTSGTIVGYSGFLAFLDSSVFGYSQSSPGTAGEYLDCSSMSGGFAWAIRSSIFREVEESIFGSVWRKYNYLRSTKSCLKKNIYLSNFSTSYTLTLPYRSVVSSLNGLAITSIGDKAPDVNIPGVATPTDCVSDGSWLGSLECGVKNVANSIVGGFTGLIDGFTGLFTNFIDSFTGVFTPVTDFLDVASGALFDFSFNSGASFYQGDFFNFIGDYSFGFEGGTPNLAPCTSERLTCQLNGGTDCQENYNICYNMAVQSAPGSYCTPSIYDAGIASQNFTLTLSSLFSTPLLSKPLSFIDWALNNSISSVVSLFTPYTTTLVPPQEGTAICLLGQVYTVNYQSYVTGYNDPYTPSQFSHSSNFTHGDKTIFDMIVIFFATIVSAIIIVIILYYFPRYD